MRKLLKYLVHYKLQSVLAPLFKLLEACFELFVPIIVAAIIDKGIGEGAGAGYIINACLILVALGAVGLAAAVAAQYFAARAAVGFSKELRHDLFKKMQGLSYSQIDALGTPRMITRMTSDVNQLQTGVNLVLRLFMRSPFIVFGAMIMAYVLDTAAGNVFAISIAVLCVAVFAIMLVSIPLYRKSQTRLDGITAASRETLTGARVLRAFCKEDDEVTSFRKKNASLTRSQLFVGRISALMNPLTYAIINVSIIALLYTGAIRVEQGAITQGTVVALYNYMSQILVELIKLANLIITVTKSFACAGRIAEILELPSEDLSGVPQTSSQNSSVISGEPVLGEPVLGEPVLGEPVLCEPVFGEPSVGAGGRTTPFIEFDSVSVNYGDAEMNALDDITFSVERGETVGIIGGTGAGKTTLINLIPRFYGACSGKVLINGVNVEEIDGQALRDMCGIAPQKAVLFGGTVRENMQWGKAGATDEEILKALDTAQAREVVEGKSGGLDEPVEQGGKNFSGGQRQRLTVARALVKRPQILILDDSSSALDYATDARLRKALKNLDYDPTVFIVSQRTSSIRHADKIIVLDGGRAVGIGTHDELLKTCEVYREIHYSQYKKEGA